MSDIPEDLEKELTRLFPSELEKIRSNPDNFVVVTGKITNLAYRSDENQQKLSMVVIPAVPRLSFIPNKFAASNYISLKTRNLESFPVFSSFAQAKNNVFTLYEISSESLLRVGASIELGIYAPVVRQSTWSVKYYFP